MKKVLSIVLTGALAASFVMSASAAEVIKIGGIGPTTGPAGIYGSSVQNAMEIAVDEVNAMGGDIQFELTFEDDMHDAETSVNAYNTLKDKGMQILGGTVTTNPCLAVGAEAVADNMLCLTPSASSQDVIDLGDNIFQVCFTDPNQGLASADYIAQQKLGTKIGVIYNSADAYSTGILNTFLAEAKTLGLDVLEPQAFTDDNSTDLTTQVQACKDGGADLIFLPIYYTPASQILKAADDMDYDVKFFGVDGMDGILSVEGFDTSLGIIIIHGDLRICKEYPQILFLVYGIVQGAFQVLIGVCFCKLHFYPCEISIRKRLYRLLSLIQTLLFG